MASFDPEREAMRHFRLDRIKRATVTEEGLRAAPRGRPGGRSGRLDAHRRGAGLAQRARVDLPRARALGARAAPRGRAERADGSIVVELSFAGVHWLVREVLKEAGDAAVLEPEDAREAVLAAVAKLRAVPVGV